MSQSSSPHQASKSLNGAELFSMFSAAAKALRRHADVVNRLNVYPVPDGDTGTNMLLTMERMLDSASRARTASASQMANAMWDGALRGSGGNSGVILAQLFKGMSVAFEGNDRIGATHFADALSQGRDFAYSAVGNPVEGTMLTVMTEAASAARESAQSTGTLLQLIQASCEAAERAVENTPNLLATLREAGVVDAGGLGLWLVLEGIRLHLNGEDAATSAELPGFVDTSDAAAGSALNFLHSTAEEEYGNCTQFTIEGPALSVDAIIAAMKKMATSTVVVGDGSLVKVHVHTESPDEVLGYARGLGAVDQVRIQNMDEQRRDYAEAWRRTAAETSNSGQALVAVVAVAWGEGLVRIFREHGATVLIAGDTMNPSVQEIADAVDAAPSSNVIFLPNNRNILPAAEQATAVTSKTVTVVPTASIPEGIGALLEFVQTLSLADNAESMTEAISKVRCGEVCSAVRSVKIDGVEAAEGQIIGLLDKKMVVSGDDAGAVLVDLLRAAITPESELVTLYWGGPMGEEEAELAAESVSDRFGHVEVELLPGGQPHYHFIVSIE
ncbi:MAG: DAK2 domain-containing protein [Chloroflexi bacterium]|nr:DAK2 domain-containing protein [Chloroflexota bacterium]